MEQKSREPTSHPFISCWYRWWLKSCTTWDVWNPKNNGIDYLSTGAGFQPSTVPTFLIFFLHQKQNIKQNIKQKNHERWISYQDSLASYPHINPLIKLTWGWNFQRKVPSCWFDIQQRSWLRKLTSGTSENGGFQEDSELGNPSIFGVTTRRKYVTWNLKITCWKRKIIFQTSTNYCVPC